MRRCCALLLLLSGCATDGAPSFDDSSSVSRGKADTGGMQDQAYPAAGALRTPPIVHLPSRTFCTATLIAKDAILTAAHCLADVAETTLGDLRFGVGPLNAPRIERRIAIDRIAIAPEYDDSFEIAHLGAPHHDIAVALLEDPIEDVVPAVIATDLAPSERAKDPCAYRAVGYGVVDTRTERQERRSADKCFVDETSDGSDVRVRGLTGGTCHGDSGGPLFVKPTQADAPLEIIGVASRAGDLESTAPLCGERSLTFFTRASAHRTFVAQALAMLRAQ